MGGHRYPESVALWLTGRPRLLVAAAWSIAAVLGGCASPEDRHKVLTVFFTGVPEPGAIPVEMAQEMSPAERREMLREATRRANFKPPSMFAHGPAASNKCEVCHQVADGQGTSRRIGPRLVSKIAELCIGCHSEKKGAAGLAAGLVVHAPVAAGACIRCHDPHRAGRQYMLKGEDSAGLCLGCHGKGEFAWVPTSAAHREDPGRDCMDCHNPHVGRTAQLLRADFDEWSLYE